MTPEREQTQSVHAVISEWVFRLSDIRIDKYQDQVTFERVANMISPRALHASTSYHGRCVVAGGWDAVSAFSPLRTLGASLASILHYVIRSQINDGAIIPFLICRR